MSLYMFFILSFFFQKVKNFSKKVKIFTFLYKYTP